MTIAEEFNQVYAQNGGLYIQPLENHFFKGIIAIGERSIAKIKALNPVLPSVYIDLINNPRIGAAATRSNDHYFIGINVGSYFLLFDLFLRMMSSPSILPEFGNSRDELGPYKIYNPQIIDLELLQNVPLEHFPKDPTRKKLASFLTSLAIEFLMIHEYAHVIFGHVDYAQSLSNSRSPYSETRRSNNLSDETAQTLEMDADCYGVVMLSRFVTNYVAAPQQLLGAEVREFYKDNNMILKLLLFAIYSFFRLFSERVMMNTHPRPGIRQLLVFETLDRLIRASGKDIISNSFIDFSSDVIKSAEDAFTLISEKEMVTTEIRLALSEEGLKHRQFLISNWKNVRPLLEPFAIGNLAP